MIVSWLWFVSCFTVQPNQQKPQFPPVVIACQQNSDCGTNLNYLTEDNRCCSSCSYKVAAKPWIAQVEAICQSKSHDGCPQKKCAAPPKVACIKGTCQAVK